MDFNFDPLYEVDLKVKLHNESMNQMALVPHFGTLCSQND